MTSEYFYLIQLVAIYVVCMIFGFAMRRLKQPVVLGYIAAGVVLGLFSFMKTPDGHVPMLITELAQIGVIILLFIAGLETDLNELKNSGVKSLIIAVGGILVSGGLATVVFTLIKGNFAQGLFLGVVVTATSVSISVQTLRELGKMKSKEGVSIIGAAIIDDIIGIILITVMLGIFASGKVGSGPESGIMGIFAVLMHIIIFFVILAIIGLIIVKLVSKVKEGMYTYEIFAAAALTTCLIIAFVASEFGIATIIGAYFTGLIFAATEHSEKIGREMVVISDVIFMPIFFASIGLGISISDLKGAFIFGIILSVVGIVGKIAGCGLGALIAGFDKKSSIRIGSGMVPRGEVTIITSGLGASIGMLGKGDVAATVMMVLVTAIVTPPLLKAAFHSNFDISKGNEG